MWRCSYCHNPDTWTMSHGIPVTLANAAAELGKYRHGLKAMSGGFTLSGGEPLMQDRFAAKLFAAANTIGTWLQALNTNGNYSNRLSGRRALDDRLVMNLKASGTQASSCT